MATSRQLVLNFKKSNGNDMSLVYNYVKENVSNAAVKSLMQGIVANGAIFENTPATIRSAKHVEKTTTDIDLS